MEALFRGRKKGTHLDGGTSKNNTALAIESGERLEGFVA